FSPFREKYNRIANLDVAPGFTGVAVVTPGQTGPYSGTFPNALINPDKNNFAPRTGFAWRPIPQGKLQIRGGYGIHYNGSIYNQFPTRLASQPPFANTATLTTSTAAPLTLQNGFPLSRSSTITNTYAIDRNYLTGYAQTWNLTVQRELPHAVTVEVGYLGTKGTRLDIQRLPNRAAPGSPLTAEQRRQIGNAVGFTYESAEGNSIYHAGQVRVSRRYRKGISANALYTYSKSIDNASTFGGGGATVAQNDKDLHAERGLSSFDRRHTLSMFYLLSTPSSRGGGTLRADSFLGRLLMDWNFSGGVTAQAGQPFTARVLGNQSNSGGTGSVGSGRADSTGETIDAGSGFFNLAAFGIPPADRFGNAGRNTILGPGLFSLNTSVSRSFRLDERRRIEFRAESSNFTNHPAFTGINTVVNASNYGLATATGPMRNISFNLRFRF
ncbi:MAG: TonB-dependent receptor, partial [Bryobacteraceae bacterium]